MPAEHLECPGLDQVDQGLDGELARPADRLGGAATHDPGRGTGERDEGDGLSESVVDAVEEVLPGKVAPGGQDPFGHHGLPEDRAARRPDERAVEVDEHG